MLGCAHLVICVHRVNTALLAPLLYVLGHSSSLELLNAFLGFLESNERVLGHPSLLVLGHSKSWDTGRVNQVLVLGLGAIFGRISQPVFRTKLLNTRFVPCGSRGTNFYPLSPKRGGDSSSFSSHNVRRGCPLCEALARGR